jgi:hypothetical protein
MESKALALEINLRTKLKLCTPSKLWKFLMESKALALEINIRTKLKLCAPSKLWKSDSVHPNYGNMMSPKL